MDTELLIKANIPLIKKIATKFYNVSFEDLYQAGCIGVLKAYKNYQKNGTTKFSTYAYDYIFGEMYECVYKNQKIKVSKELLRLQRKIEVAYSSLCQKLNRHATYEEVATFLNLPLELIYEAISSNSSVVSLDDKINDDGCWYEVIENKEENISLDDRLVLEEGINSLKEEERKIINYRYFKDYTQTETAKKLNMTQVMVSRYEQNSLKKLRKFYDVV